MLIRKIIRKYYYPMLLTTMRQYNRKAFYSDVMAGLIVGIVALPLSIAFGIASGVTPEKGIITAIIAGFLISALGGSHVQIGGPTGAFIIIVYGIIEQFGLNGLIIATIIAGFILLLMGIFKLGTIIKFMPYPIVVGFTSGIAVVIFSSQLQDILGLTIHEKIPSNIIEKLILFSKYLDQVNIQAFFMTVLTIALIIWTPVVSRKIPGTLIALIVTTLLVYFFKLPVDTIGTRIESINTSFPEPTFPNITLSTFRLLLFPAFTIAMLGAIESLLSAMVADGAIGKNHRSNTELIAQGIANICTGIFGGIPATGAIARTMTNIRNGGKTPVAGIIHALVLLLILLFFGKYAKMIPMSCLAGILAVVAYNMSEWRSFKRLLKNSKLEVGVLISTFLLTVLVDLTIAILFGILLAFVLFMKRIIETTQIDVIKHEIDSENEQLQNNSGFAVKSDIAIPKDVELFEMRGPFFFGVANIFNEIEKQVSNSTQKLIIDLWRVPFIDSTAANNFRNFLLQKQQQGTSIFIIKANIEVRNELSKNGIEQLIGTNNFFDNLEEAIESIETSNKSQNITLS